MGREYFCAYHSYLRSCQGLSDGEVGRLFRALLAYSESGARSELNGRESVAFDFMAANIDRDVAEYQSKCERNRQNAGKRYDRMRWHATAATACDGCQEEEKEKDKEELKEKVPPNGGTKKKGAAAPTPPERNRYGAYGWVRLSGEEYARLLADYGEATVKAYIAVVDELAQQTGNKNKWKDWNLTLRKAIRNQWGQGPSRQLVVNGGAHARTAPPEGYSDPERYEKSKGGWK